MGRDRPNAGSVISRGREYARVSEMPAEVRREYEELRRKIDEVTLEGADDEWEEGTPRLESNDRSCHAGRDMHTAGFIRYVRR